MIYRERIADRGASTPAAGISNRELAMDDDELIPPTQIPTLLNVSALARTHGVTRRIIKRRLGKGWAPSAGPALPVQPATSDRAASDPVFTPWAPTHAHTVGAARGMRVFALLTAVALAGVSAFFGINGMTAIFAAAVVPVMVMVGVLEAAKLVTAAWLARHWRVAPLTLRALMCAMVLALMCITAVGTFGFLSRAHLEHQASSLEAVDRDAAPIAQQIEMAQTTVTDLDGQIGRLDDMVQAATSRAWTRTAMGLVDSQAKSRAQLVTERQAAAEKLADLKVEESNIEAQRARVASDSGPALYLAKLFGSEDTEGMVRGITALLVLTLDPLAILLTIAAVVV